MCHYHYWVPAMLPCEKRVFPFIFPEKKGLVAELRYLSINSVKRGVVPDRNVLLKGICWTVPSMPWWVLKFAGEQPRSRRNKERLKDRGETKFFQDDSHLTLLISPHCSIYEQTGKNRRQRGEEKIDGCVRHQGHTEIMQAEREGVGGGGGGIYLNILYSNKMRKGRKEVVRPSEDMKEETSGEDIWLAGGKEAKGDRRRERNRRWRSYFTLLVFPHRDPLVLCEINRRWLHVTIYTTLGSLPISAVSWPHLECSSR